MNIGNYHCGMGKLLSRTAEFVCVCVCVHVRAHVRVHVLVLVSYPRQALTSKSKGQRWIRLGMDEKRGHSCRY